ncbi:hypothetical protein BDK51DRAFT_37701 [Blyttiomyces helicus]|uniref:Uncharacterized protein n=1 Tax=Blyttiomyces helicus TaxID=388810 RepID=A0A4P9VUU4_9FUNG|nr:hypothetical protein BDK51DRAFT_37701 [Blyttiomyces helicus]|eukprot:RKO83379.1 hypothetical protein BDK51DRAFT_37701 [Blyttiomyces helicus]
MNMITPIEAPLLTPALLQKKKHARIALRHGPLPVNPRPRLAGGGLTDSPSNAKMILQAVGAALEERKRARLMGVACFGIAGESRAKRRGGSLVMVGGRGYWAGDLTPETIRSDPQEIFHLNRRGVELRAIPIGALPPEALGLGTLATIFRIMAEGRGTTHTFLADGDAALGHGLVTAGGVRGGVDGGADWGCGHGDGGKHGAIPVGFGGDDEAVKVEVNRRVGDGDGGENRTIGAASGAATRWWSTGVSGTVTEERTE